MHSNLNKQGSIQGDTMPCMALLGCVLILEIVVHFYSNVYASSLRRRSVREVWELQTLARGEGEFTYNPLREFLGLKIAVELGQVLILGQSISTGVGVVDYGRVVLSDVVVCLGLLIDPGLSFKSRIWHVLLVLRPGNTLILQQIDDAGDIARNLVEIIIVHAKVVTTNRGNVVGLTRVSDSVVVAQRDAFLGQPGKVGIASSFVIVGVLEPDSNEAIEHLAFDVAGRA